MNHYINLLCKSIALKHELSESDTLEIAVLLLALALEPEADEYPLWVRICRDADRFQDNIIEVMKEARVAYIDEMEGEDDNRDNDL